MAEPTSSFDAWLDALLARTPFIAPVAVLLGAVVLGVLRGPGAAVLALAGGALLAAIAGLWNSLRVLAGDAPISLHEAIDLGAPSPLQERKQKILLALKDLQREHALGKISDEDFKELSARYRAEAKQLLREMDEDLAPAREKAEALLAARLSGTPGVGKENRSTVD
ncbi:MAG: hypothetical protein RMJ98_16420 [Myxococcales bacterium]|nr:hypothetical protein [Polyangiaceae bacterium]MDW8250880.1 hypothetical protein [Myxococcales bacterium]